MKAKKSLGQNFLKSKIILNKIVSAGNISEKDTVLEIGPGKGSLTEILLAQVGKVIAVEKDNELLKLLQEKFATEIKSGSLVLVHDDILNFNPETYDLMSGAYKLIANIPYNITGAILKKFLTNSNQPENMILMIQYEVAKRIVARDGKESLLSISVKAYGLPKIIAKVKAQYFSPKPNVDSAIIKIDHISKKLFINNLYSVQSQTLNRIGGDKMGKLEEFEEKFWKIVHAGFAHKRKKLSGNLKNVLDTKNELFLTFRDKRAEDLSLSDWIILASI